MNYKSSVYINWGRVQADELIEKIKIIHDEDELKNELSRAQINCIFTSCPLGKHP